MFRGLIVFPLSLALFFSFPLNLPCFQLLSVFHVRIENNCLELPCEILFGFYHPLMGSQIIVLTDTWDQDVRTSPLSIQQQGNRAGKTDSSFKANHRIGTSLANVGQRVVLL